MQITKIGSQVEKNPLRVSSFKRAKVMVLVVDFKPINFDLNLSKSNVIGYYRVSGRGQTYNDWCWTEWGKQDAKTTCDRIKRKLYRIL